MATKSTKTPKKKAATAKPAPRGVGVIAEIQRMMERQSGATVDEIVQSLSAKFPDRSPEGMATTARIQVRRLPKKLGRKLTTEESEGRGVIYRLA